MQYWFYLSDIQKFLLSRNLIQKNLNWRNLVRHSCFCPLFPGLLLLEKRDNSAAKWAFLLGSFAAYRKIPSRRIQAAQLAAVPLWHASVILPWESIEMSQGGCFAPEANCYKKSRYTMQNRNKQDPNSNKDHLASFSVSDLFRSDNHNSDTSLLCGGIRDTHCAETYVCKVGCDLGQHPR